MSKCLLFYKCRNCRKHFNVEADQDFKDIKAGQGPLYKAHECISKSVLPVFGIADLEGFQEVKEEKNETNSNS